MRRLRGLHVHKLYSLSLHVRMRGIVAPMPIALWITKISVCVGLTNGTKAGRMWMDLLTYSSAAVTYSIVLT